MTVAPIRLGDLQQTRAIVDSQGLPSPELLRVFNSNARNTANAFTNLVSILQRLGLVEVTADGALELADSAINPDGTIKTAKVLTDSITPEGVTSGVYVQNASVITLPNAVDTTILNLSLTKAIDESEIDITSTLRMESSDDIIGEFRLYRDGAPGVGTLIDSVEYDCRTNGSTFKAIIPYSFVDETALAGVRSYHLSFERNGGGSNVQANPGCLMRPREFKR